MDTQVSRREAIKTGFRLAVVNELICIHRDSSAVDKHENSFTCVCNPIVIEKLPNMTEAEFLQIAYEKIGN